MGPPNYWVYILDEGVTDDSESLFSPQPLSFYRCRMYVQTAVSCRSVVPFVLNSWSLSAPVVEVDFDARACKHT